MASGVVTAIYSMVPSALKTGIVNWFSILLEDRRAQEGQTWMVVVEVAQREESRLD